MVTVARALRRELLSVCSLQFQHERLAQLRHHVFQPRVVRNSLASAVADGNSPCVKNACRGAPSGSSQRISSRCPACPLSADIETTAARTGTS